MRLWSINLKYLDNKGLVALWREGLLAQSVLLNLTKGYKNHPQLDRFKVLSNPLNAIGTYLYYVYLEAKNRGFKFDKSKIKIYDINFSTTVTKDQIYYEYRHLQKKLFYRSQKYFNELNKIKEYDSHPMFNIVEGGIEKWEKVN